jgi:hypothetical protein
MAKHSIILGYHIEPQVTILCTKSRYTDRMIRETVEDVLHPNNMNREGDIRLRWSFMESPHPNSQRT